MKSYKNYITVIFLLILYVYVSYISLIPSNIVLFKNENLNIRKLLFIDIIESTKTSTENQDVSNVELKLFGKFLLKDISIVKIEKAEVVPIGKIIGLKLYTNGVLVVGTSELLDSKFNIDNRIEKSNIKAGDIILKIDNFNIESISDIKELVNKSKGKNLELTILRDGIIITSNLIPIKTENNDYKLGLWVKDAATGVGTITYYEPKSNFFAVLGHGISDIDTGKIIDVDYGELVTSKVLSLKKAENGIPGEIRGTIINQQKIGEVFVNTNFGVFGKLNNLSSLNIDSNKKIEVAERSEIELGKAKILCATDNTNTTKEYDINIERLYLNNNVDNKSMLIKITDKDLIDKTGGIIRGLSGAPIIQNEKFVGAITNVLVSNPEIGYAVFGDLMIKEMNK